MNGLTLAFIFPNPSAPWADSCGINDIKQEMALTLPFCCIARLRVKTSGFNQSDYVPDLLPLRVNSLPSMRQPDGLYRSIGWKFVSNLGVQTSALVLVHGFVKLVPAC